jgi:hypothetical protein
VDDSELLDALHAAGIGVSHFVDLLHEKRSDPRHPSHKQV